MRFGDIYKSNYKKNEYYIFIGYKDKNFFSINLAVNKFFNNLQDILIDDYGFMAIQSDSDARTDIIDNLSIYRIDYLCERTLLKDLTYTHMNISKEVNRVIVKNGILKGYVSQGIKDLIRTKEEYEIKKKEYIDLFKKRYKVFLEAKQGDFFIDGNLMIQYLGVYSHIYDLKDPRISEVDLDDLDYINCIVGGRYISQISFERFLSMKKQESGKIRDLETDGVRKYRDFKAIKRDFKGIDINL